LTADDPLPLTALDNFNDAYGLVALFEHGAAAAASFAVAEPQAHVRVTGEDQHIDQLGEGFEYDILRLLGL